ncbi:hypothetical protein FRC01_011744, partial [Tulasnella sp. 417]
MTWMKALHTGIGAKRASEEDAEGLEKEILLAENAKIMITRNLWTTAGLVNGAQGIVHQIIYPPGANPQQDLPAVILVKMDVYTGPPSPWTDGDISLIPIVPSIARWESSTGSQCSQKQFPLTVAFGITIHKSQGMTLDHAVLELGPKDFAPGLAFVGISR